MHPALVDYWAETAKNITPDLIGTVCGAVEDIGET